MCLDFVTRIYEGKSKIVRDGYKILTIAGNFQHARKIISKGMWMEAALDYSTNLSIIGTMYSPGFHVFRSKKDAKMYAKKRYSSYRIVKVQVKGCLARGWQDSVRVEVYKYIKFTRIR